MLVTLARRWVSRILCLPPHGQSDCLRSRDQAKKRHGLHAISQGLRAFKSVGEDYLLIIKGEDVSDEGVEGQLLAKHVGRGNLLIV